MRSRKAASRAAICRIAALAAGLLVLSPVPAQDRSEPPDRRSVDLPGAPGWLVPVLRVLSPDRVVPTAGVVLAPGRVLVPSEFVVDATSLVVLDGGADLARYGRPASISARYPRDGLAVLSVPGLDRSPPTLAPPPVNGAVVELLALPPAELLVQGVPLVRRRAEVELDGQGRAALSAERPLPNLTGALVDACGHWVGFSAARGVASLATGTNTLYRWQPDLASRLAGAGVDLATGACDRRLALDPVSDPLSEPSPPASEVRPAHGADPRPGTGAAGADGAPEPPTAPAFPPVVELDLPEVLSAPGLPPAGREPETAAQERGGEQVAGRGMESALDERDDARWHSWTATLLLLAGGLASGWVARSLVARRSAAQPEPGNRVAGFHENPAPAALEPAAARADRTAFLLVGEGERHPVPGRPGEGGMTVDCLIGRYDADVLLADPSISRHHARLRGVRGRLAIHDLDTTNGTAVNGEVCRPGAGVAVGPGDRVRLGRRTYTLEAAEP